MKQLVLPILPPDSQWRYFKFKFSSKHVVQLRDRITNPVRLLNWINKLQPQDVYVSVSCFLDPTISGKKRDKRRGLKWYHNLFLKGDFVIDIDSKDMENITNCNIALKEIGFRKFLTTNTSRGIQIWCLDFWEKYCHEKLTNPFLREQYYMRQKKELAKKLLEKGIEFDYLTTIDSRRVVRVPNTFHRDGTFCTGSYSFINGGNPKGDDEHPKSMRTGRSMVPTWSGTLPNERTV